MTQSPTDTIREYVYFGDTPDGPVKFDSDFFPDQQKTVDLFADIPDQQNMVSISRSHIQELRNMSQVVWNLFGKEAWKENLK